MKMVKNRRLIGKCACQNYISTCFWSPNDLCCSLRRTLLFGFEVVIRGDGKEMRVVVRALYCWLMWTLTGVSCSWQPFPVRSGTGDGWQISQELIDGCLTGFIKQNSCTIFVMAENDVSERKRTFISLLPANKCIWVTSFWFLPDLIILYIYCKCIYITYMVEYTWFTNASYYYYYYYTKQSLGWEVQYIISEISGTI